MSSLPCDTEGCTRAGTHCTRFIIPPISRLPTFPPSLVCYLGKRFCPPCARDVGRNTLPYEPFRDAIRFAFKHQGVGFPDFDRATWEIASLDDPAVFAAWDLHRRPPPDGSESNTTIMGAPLAWFSAEEVARVQAWRHGLATAEADDAIFDLVRGVKARAKREGRS